MKSKVTYYCTECGNETPKWQGRCSACGATVKTESRAPLTNYTKGDAEPSIVYHKGGEK